MKVPPGPMANVLRIRSLASHATVQVWRHSPSTKRMTVPPGALQGQAAQLGQAVLELRPPSFRRQRESTLRQWRTSERARWILEYCSLLLLDKIRLVCFPAAKPGANLC